MNKSVLLLHRYSLALLGVIYEIQMLADLSFSIVYSKWLWAELSVCYENSKPNQYWELCGLTDFYMQLCTECIQQRADFKWTLYSKFQTIWLVIAVGDFVYLLRQFTADKSHSLKMFSQWQRQPLLSNSTWYSTCSSTGSKGRSHRSFQTWGNGKPPRSAFITFE